MSAAATILLVDDWDEVRRAVRRALETHGHRVLAAADAVEAVALAARSPDRIDLLILDASLLRGPGAQAARGVRAICPDAPVLFISGRPRGEALREGLVDSDAAFLQKPFLWGKLLAEVRALLDRPRS